MQLHLRWSSSTRPLYRPTTFRYLLLKPVARAREAATEAAAQPLFAEV